MENKVLLILVDGMRPDSLACCGDDRLEPFFRAGTYCLQAQTTFPPVTLPCHMSLFHSVDPGRHGTTTNVYVPQVRPINGLIEVLSAAQKKCAFFYTWEQLRDLCTPGKHLEFSWFKRQYTETVAALEKRETAAAIEYIAEEQPDFVFLYLGGVDCWGHRTGWMSPEYLAAVKNASECIHDICAGLPENYTVIVTADHGGHDRTHGEDIPEDMTTPVTVHGKLFPAGKELDCCDIRDLAPTIVDILGLQPDEEWEGTSILKKI
ncbi:MAG: alkaline phosphatase family protein [Butyricicoccus sp.]|nr:alkaline phosphatase family protein [Butyricicoccus sp.]MBQ8586263.1 alkaline phosphatase family protein [Butyricicoccus sp.]